METLPTRGFFQRRLRLRSSRGSAGLRMLRGRQTDLPRGDSGNALWFSFSCVVPRQGVYGEDGAEKLECEEGMVGAGE